MLLIGLSAVGIISCCLFYFGGFEMQLLEERILKDGKVFPGNVLKVDSFLNHQVDVELINEIGKEFYRLFKDCGVNKIFTIEASGIGIACITAQYFHVPVVFAKKTLGKNIAADVYSTPIKSFTHGKTYDVIVSQEFLNKDDRILIIDDFLAQGCALNGLIELIKSAGAQIVGAGIVIEKAFQQGGVLIRSEGVRVESLARIESMTNDGKITFCK
jgi:xanthine phosphoribosyltransferase